MKLTKQQILSIKHSDSNLQIIACAGSGKTEVVARKVAYLLKNKSLLPRNIIAFTFTEKAAAELKDRIYDRCREEIGNLAGMAEMFVGTIHGFSLDLLKTELADLLKYEVLNEVQRILFIDRHSLKSGLTASTDLAGKKLRRFIDTSNYATAMDLLREAAIDARKMESCSVWEGCKAYMSLLTERSYFDYSAILDRAVEELLANRQLRKVLKGRAKYVIVDEYQDVNPVQEAIIEALYNLGAKLCVVGDDDQTIYQWRASDVRNMLSFKGRYEKVVIARLQENFRSSEGIIETARPFIEQNAERLPKRMVSVGAQDYEPGDIVALSFDDPDKEGEYVADSCRTLLGAEIREPEGGKRGIAWSDMAVLLRSVARNGEPIARAFDRAKIPYIIIGMNELFRSREAIAARTLFYFMAERCESGEVLAAWEAANTGSTRAELNRAISAAQQSRGQMQKGMERFSTYSPQRVFLDFMENAKIREEKVVGKGRGEVLFYNLGKFSQLISDFEAIHFLSNPVEKYASFADFLKYGAEGAYPEGWQDKQYASPNAVRIMTIHQAKGMQWPVVFLPALLKNRFPSKKQGGRSVWHLIPKDAVKGQERFEGSLEDERRLFYVAMTRAQKYLHMTWAPVPDNRLYKEASEFWHDVLVSKYVKRHAYAYSRRKHLPPQPKTGVSNVIFSFSDLKYFFECPYQFKLRILYGFNAPIDEALGYGKSLHDALAEVHGKAIRGEPVDEKYVPELINRHLRTPYAYPKLREQLESSAAKVLRQYIVDNKKDFKNIEFFEKNIEILMGDGISIKGRIDLVRRKDTDETTIVDLKSTHRAQAENVTETQLHIYALGYKELTGRNADFVEIYNLDEGKRRPRSVDDDLISEVKARVRGAAGSLIRNDLAAAPSAKKCGSCDYHSMCSSAQ